MDKSAFTAQAPEIAGFAGVAGLEGAGTAAA
jgi:hypothetical protein